MDASTLERRAWAEVNLNRLKKNYEAIKAHVNSDVGVMGVVKADAYGHGTMQVARKLEALGASFLATATVTEAVTLREGGIRSPILVMGGFLPGQERSIVEHDITPAIYTFQALEGLSKVARKANKTILCHVKVDTGMGRLGIESSRVVDLFSMAKELSSVMVEGLFTHFASADESLDDYTESQIGAFRKVIAEVEAAGYKIKFKHAANSAGTLFHPDSWFNLVRPGLSLYGVNPSEDKKGGVSLEPILSFKASVMLVKRVPADTPLGYSRTFTTKRDSVIATLAVGYADGLNRLLSNKGRVIVHDKCVPIVGNVSMDLTLIDVTDVPEVSIGDMVTIIGCSGSASITAWDIARQIGTIPYEVLTNISKRVTRVYVD